MPIEFIARVKCDRPGCDATGEFPVLARIEDGRGRDRVVMDADYPVGVFNEMCDARGDHWRVECRDCYADQDRFAQRPCCVCRELRRPELLVDVRDYGAFLTEACVECAAGVIFDAHEGEPPCTCEWCDAARAKADRERRAVEAATYGGFRKETAELFGRQDK